jgi:hypothetical protein
MAAALASQVPKGVTTATVSITYRFEKPGTHFPVLRGVSQRQGNTDAPYARISNLGRVSVVVK